MNRHLTIIFLLYEDFESNAKIKGLPVVKILKDIDDADVF